MGITYEDAVKAQAELEDRILQDPNVVSIGVIADIDNYGNKTGDYVIKIGVISSEDYQYSLTHGESIIPRSYLLEKDNPHQEKCVRIKVVKTGKVNALTESDTLNKTYFPSAIDKVNFVDAAVAEVSGGTNWAKYVMPFISQIGYPTDYADAKIGMQVEKTGRTTGYTIGTVLSVNQTVKVTYEKIGGLLFKNQISTTNMSKGGDSGSSLFEARTKKPVGLLFAGDNSESFHNPLKIALSKLSEEHTCTYSSGKVYSFKSDFPFAIIQKRPYPTRATVHSSRVRVNSLLSLGKQPQKYRLITLATVLGVNTAIASASRFQTIVKPTVNPKKPLPGAAARCRFFGGTAAKQAIITVLSQKPGSPRTAVEPNISIIKQ